MARSLVFHQVMAYLDITVLVWFGLHDDQLDVEHGERRYGPYAPNDGPIPLHRYRRFKKTRTQQRADRIEGLAERLSLPQAALSERPALSASLAAFAPATQPFADPDPFHKLPIPSALEAKRAIADHLGLPMAKLSPEQLAALNTLRWPRCAPFYTGNDRRAGRRPDVKSPQRARDGMTDPSQALATSSIWCIHKAPIRI